MTLRAFRVDPRLLELARRMRREAAPAEKVLWSCLRNRQLGAFKFRRQYPVDRYVADFCCPACALIVELDGDSHQDREKNDAERTQFLERAGFRVLRVVNTDVYETLEEVLLKILETCEGSRQPSKPPLTPPLP